MKKVLLSTFSSPSFSLSICFLVIPSSFVFCVYSATKQKVVVQERVYIYTASRKVIIYVLGVRKEEERRLKSRLRGRRDTSILLSPLTWPNSLFFLFYLVSDWSAWYSASTRALPACFFLSSSANLLVSLRSSYTAAHSHPAYTHVPHIFFYTLIGCFHTPSPHV